MSRREGPNLLAAHPAAESGPLVVERRPVDGRLVHILDPQALVVRGEEVIENATL